MKQKTKELIYLIIIFILIILVGILTYKFIQKENLLQLPLPKVSEGKRGKLGIDVNINEDTIDNYLGREDSVYFDMRMLEEEANWENIGGASNITGFVKGFEVLPLPYLTTGIINSELAGLVGAGYTGKTLFTLEENGTYTANYEESMEILEYFFPKDKYIFLMCGGGGYAGNTKSMLVKLGWDTNKIYNVGGYWYYDGKNNVEVLNSKGTYDWWKIIYHKINFEDLTEV